MGFLTSSIFVKVPSQVQHPPLGIPQLRSSIYATIPSFSGTLRKGGLEKLTYPTKLLELPPSRVLRAENKNAPNFIFPPLPPKSPRVTITTPNISYIIPKSLSFRAINVPQINITTPSINFSVPSVPYVPLNTEMLTIPVPPLPPLPPIDLQVGQVIKHFFVDLMEYLSFSTPLDLSFSDYRLVAKKSQPDYLSNMRSQDIHLSNARVEIIKNTVTNTMSAEVAKLRANALNRWRLLEFESDVKRISIITQLYEKFIDSIQKRYKLLTTHYAITVKSRIVLISAMRAVLKRNSLAIEALRESFRLAEAGLEINDSIIKAGETINSLNNEAISLTERGISIAEKYMDLSRTNTQILRNYIDGYMALIRAAEEVSKQEVLEAQINNIRERVLLAPMYARSVESHYLRESSVLKKETTELIAQITSLNTKIQSFKELVDMLSEGRVIEEALFKIRGSAIESKGRASVAEVRLNLKEKVVNLRERFYEILQNIRHAISKANLELMYLNNNLEVARARGKTNERLSIAEYNRANRLARTQMEMAVLEVLGRD